MQEEQSKTTMSQIKVIVCGGRDYNDRGSVFAVLDRIHARVGVALVKHGQARGADRLAGEWAESRGVAVQAFPADWEGLGKRAGILRNIEIADSGADLCVAFPGGKGTAHMAGLCKSLGIPTVEIPV